MARDLVELEVALAASDRPEELLLSLRGFNSRKGGKTRPGVVDRRSSGRLRLAGGKGE